MKVDTGWKCQGAPDGRRLLVSTRSGARISLLLRTCLCFAAAVFASCGGVDTPNVWRLYKDGRFSFVRKGPPVVTHVVSKGGLRAHTTKLTDGQRTLVGVGTLTVREDTLLAGVVLENPSYMVRNSHEIELTLAPKVARRETKMLSRAGPLWDGTARWAPLSIAPGEYEWSARITLRSPPSETVVSWPKIAVLWAYESEPREASVSARSGDGEDTRPSFVMTSGTEVVCPLPEGGAWRLEASLAHPSAEDGVGKINVFLDTETGRSHLACFNAKGVTWRDTLAVLPELPSNAHLRLSCEDGEVVLGAPLLVTASRAARERYRHPNVLLISLDTVRADHVDPLGSLNLTPSLAALADRSVVFERAACQAPVTDASHHSIFTGLQVPRHGGDERQVPSEGIPTLATCLQEEGYRTAGFTDNNLVSAAFGFARGFDRYWEHSAPYGDKLHLREILACCRQWIEGMPPNRPWLAFVHTYQAHSPYRNHERPGLPLVSANPSREPITMELLHRHMEAVGDSEQRTDSELLNLARRNYASEIEHLDAALGEFLTSLEDGGHLVNTMIVVLSDHGEGFLEHGFVAHDNSLYQELIHIPLLIRFPGDEYAGTRVRQVVQTVDLLPTVLEFAGLGCPPDIDGVSLLDACRTGTAERRPALATHRHSFSVTLWPHKLIIPRDGSGPSLYRLDADPSETKDLLWRTDPMPALIDSLVAPLTDILRRSHHGHMIEIARPTSGMGPLVLRGDGVVESQCLLTDRRDHVRRQRDGLVIALDPSRQGEVVLLVPADSLAAATTGQGEPTKLRAGVNSRGSYRLVVERCLPIPRETAQRRPQDLGPELQNRLRALGYLD